MGAVFRLINNPLFIDPSARVMKSQDLALFLEANEALGTAQRHAEKILLDAQKNADEISQKANAEAERIVSEAKTQADQILQQAQEIYESRKQEGYDDGILEGRMEQSEKMLETALQAVEYIENIEKTIVNVVYEAVRKVIGEIDDKERIVRVVRVGLQSVRSQQKVLIHVSPDDVPAISEALEVMLSSAPGAVSLMDVKGDPRMKRGDCIIESELGVVDAGLETQLKAIERALH